MKRFAAGLIVGLVAALAIPTFAADPVEPPPVKLVVNGQEIAFPDAPPTIINGRTMVPARPLAEALGAEVEWDDSTRTVIVSSPKSAAPGEESITAGSTVYKNPRDLSDQYGLSLRQVVADGRYYLRFEGNGGSVDMPLFGGPEVNGTASSGTTVRGWFENSRLLIMESDLREAGIIKE